MNVARFFGLPNALKPVALFLILLAMIVTGVAPLDRGASVGGSWFVWLTLIVQLVFMSAVSIAFLFEMESLMTCGQEAWPVAEITYSIIFAACDAISMFVVAGWTRVGSGAFIFAALLLFALVILYGLGAFMMFRIWRGFVSSGASQNPTAGVQPGSIGAMNPGL